MKRPLTITLAALLGFVYALVLLGVALVMLYELIWSRGNIGHQHLDLVAAQGVVFVTVVLMIGSLLLAVGSWKLYFQAKRTLLFVPLVLFLVVGCIGETADILGTATTSSNLIGGGILLLAALPVGLCLMPASRSWLHQR